MWSMCGGHVHHAAATPVAGPVPQTFLTRTARITQEHMDAVFVDCAQKRKAQAGCVDLPAFQSNQGFGAPTWRTHHPAIRHICEVYSSACIAAGSTVTLVVRA